MGAGIYIADQSLGITFDGTQRIPKILSYVEMNRGDTIKSVALPRPIQGELYYYFQSNYSETSPYGNPLVFNYKVSVSGTVATVEYLKVFEAIPSVTIPFTVYIGEF